MKTAEETFEEVRRALALADEGFVAALEQRAAALAAIRTLRQAHPDRFFGLPSDESLMDRARTSVKAFPKEGLEAAFREVLSASAKALGPVSVAAVGPVGSFCHLAARQRFGRSADLRMLDGVAAVLDEVERGRTNYGVVPFETSSDGAVTSTLHGLVDADVKICGEWVVPISYHLYSELSDAEGPVQRASDIQEIVATPLAIAACERQLRTHYPRARIVDVESCDVAASTVLERRGVAALGTSLVAETHRLHILRERVEDEPNVQARFAVVGREYPSRTGSDRTILVVSLRDEPGALLTAIRPFAERGLNLARLELRPARRTDRGILFFMEIDGHMTDRAILASVEEVRAGTRDLKVLGSFPLQR